MQKPNTQPEAEKPASSAPSVSKRVLSNESRSEAERLLDQRAYSRLLGDVLNGDLGGPAPLRRAN